MNPTLFRVRIQRPDGSVGYLKLDADAAEPVDAIASREDAEGLAASRNLAWGRAGFAYSVEPIPSAEDAS